MRFDFKAVVAAVVSAIAMLPSAQAAGGSRFDDGIGFFVGVDSNTVIGSGAYAGLVNPNAGRLTLLFDDGDHFHSIGAYSLSGPAAAPTALATNANNRIPELYTRTAPGSDAIPLQAGSGLFAGTWASRVLPASVDSHGYSHLGMASIQSLDGLSPEAGVLLHSSADRWSGAFDNVNVGLRLNTATAGLRVADGSTLDIFGSGSTYTLGGSGNLTFLPTFYVDAAASPGTYSASFSLVNLGSNTNVRNGGDFFFDLSVPAPVPEPGTWALMAAGLALVAARKRKAVVA